MSTPRSPGSTRTQRSWTRSRRRPAGSHLRHRTGDGPLRRRDWDGPRQVRRRISSSPTSSRTRTRPVSSRRRAAPDTWTRATTNRARMALGMVGYADLAAKKAKAKSRGKLLGLGLSTYIEVCGVAPSKWIGAVGEGWGAAMWESSDIKMHLTGKTVVTMGTQPQGQGARRRTARSCRTSWASRWRTSSSSTATPRGHRSATARTARGPRRSVSARRGSRPRARPPRRRASSPRTCSKRRFSPTTSSPGRAHGSRCLSSTSSSRTPGCASRCSWPRSPPARPGHRPRGRRWGRAGRGGVIRRTYHGAMAADPAPPAPGPYLQTVSGRFVNPFDPTPRSSTRATSRARSRTCAASAATAGRSTPSPSTP